MKVRAHQSARGRTERVVKDLAVSHLFFYLQQLQSQTRAQLLQAQQCRLVEQAFVIAGRIELRRRVHTQ